MTNSDMQTKQNDISPQQARAALAWLIEMGADEIIAEAPANRFGAISKPAVTAAAAPETVRPAMASAAKKPIERVGTRDANSCASIDEITAALVQMDDCPLKRTASNLCFASGDLEAPVMVMGDVPGRDEDIEGKVFAGANALLLEKMLGAIGLSLETVGLINFIPWRPPGNRAVTEAEIMMCQPYIQRAITLCRPKFILCFGQLPMQRLLGRSESLMASRGKFFAYGESKIPLLASFHPSYLILQAAQKRLAWRDLLTFKEALDGGTP
jgi:uracil-DNA glycosylase family 4